MPVAVLGAGCGGGGSGDTESVAEEPPPAEGVEEVTPTVAREPTPEPTATAVPPTPTPEPTEVPPTPTPEAPAGPLRFTLDEFVAAFNETHSTQIAELGDGGEFEAFMETLLLDADAAVVSDAEGGLLYEWDLVPDRALTLTLFEADDGQVGSFALGLNTFAAEAVSGQAVTNARDLMFLEILTMHYGGVEDAPGLQRFAQDFAGAPFEEFSPVGDLWVLHPNNVVLVVRYDGP